MKNTKTLTANAMLTAIILIMAFTPIGYLKAGVIEITFITIPVIVGAIVLGEKTGLFLGGVFGITSFIQAVTGMSEFGAVLMGINPVFTFIVCLIPRLLMGYFCGLIFRAIPKQKSNNLAVIVSSVSGSLLNTFFFMTALMVLFGSTDYISGMRGNMSVIKFVIAFVGLNGAVEALACAVLGTAICKAVLKIKG